LVPLEPPAQLTVTVGVAVTLHLMRVRTQQQVVGVVRLQQLLQLAVLLEQA
jgi:hypothetical protein